MMRADPAQESRSLLYDLISLARSEEKGAIPLIDSGVLPHKTTSVRGAVVKPPEDLAEAESPTQALTGDNQGFL